MDLNITWNNLNNLKRSNTPLQSLLKLYHENIAKVNILFLRRESFQQHFAQKIGFLDISQLQKVDCIHVKRMKTEEELSACLSSTTSHGDLQGSEWQQEKSLP